MKKITQSDIDTLIDVVNLLKGFENQEDNVELKNKYHQQLCRLRKIYMLLLNASANGQLDLKWACNEGVADDSPLGIAIDNLCKESLQSN